MTQNPDTILIDVLLLKVTVRHSTLSKSSNLTDILRPPLAPVKFEFFTDIE